MAEAHWRQAPAPPGVSNKHIPDFSEAPPCVQNAMLTKDKKPFTYTPGGIDLSEIRSPRMARRLERNAMSEGVTPNQQVPPGQHRAGPLPPSALAAMQPQLPVQVFPSGKVPQLPHGGPPPPPPPPMKAPQPLPRDSFERPDMTKIIPDNPMALLRKTQGPVVKQDPILNKSNYVENKTNNAYVPQAPAPKINNTQVGSIYIPPVNQASPQTPPFTNARDSPTGSIPPPPPFYKRQPSLQQTEPQSPTYTVQSKHAPVFDNTPPQTPDSPKATLSKAPTPWLKQKSQSQELPEWAVNDQKAINANIQELAQAQKPKHQRPWSQKSFEKTDTDGSLPYEQVKREPQWQQQSQPSYQQQRQPVQIESPQWQPKQPESVRREQSSWQPEAQRQRQPETQNWQQTQQEPQSWRQNQQDPQSWRQNQHEPQSWRQNQQEAQSYRQNQQQEIRSNQPSRTAQSPPVYMPQSAGVRQQVQNRETPQAYYPNEKVEVVIVNDPPMILQHPGQNQRVQRQQPAPQQNQNVRIIPVQFEGATSNGHGNNDPRVLNRQLSWNSTPTQSNTFKVLQKITQTDRDDENDDQTVVEHSPKTHHSFPQHRMMSNQGDHELMNKYKQVHEDPPNNRGPKVRTIPIQIEGDGPMRTFVPPSEQTVAEPKKYMGSSIPSRSFKILQAMTAPDECAKPEQSSENNENYSNDSTMCPQWSHHPNFPMQPSPLPHFYNPYWHYYDPYGKSVVSNAYNGQTHCQYYKGQSDSECDSDTSQNKSSRATPVMPYFYWPHSDLAKNARSTPTPIPFFPYYPPGNYTNPSQEEETTSDGNTAPYPTWNPYCYYYAVPPPPPPHMYPPLYPPYFPQPQQSDTEENSGYSSTDEMSYYGARFKTMPPFSNSATKRTSSTTPTLQQKILEEIRETAKKLEESRKKRQQLEEDTSVVKNIAEKADTIVKSGLSIESEVCIPSSDIVSTAPSVCNINVFDEGESSDEIEDSESTTEDMDDSLGTVDETIPHQLSVIFEESERTESMARHIRESSIESGTTEGTNTLENIDHDIEEETTVLIKLPLKVNYTLSNIVKFTIEERKIMSQVALLHEFCVKEELNDSNNDKNYCRTPKDVRCDVSNEKSGIDNEGNVKNILNSDSLINDSEEEEEEEVDFWASIRKDESYVNIRQKLRGYSESETTKDDDQCEANEDKKSLESVEEEEVLEKLAKNEENSSYDSKSEDEEEEVDFWAEIINNNEVVDEVFIEEPDQCSACYVSSSLSSSSKSEETIRSCQNTSLEQYTHDADSNEIKTLSIQERIRALYESTNKQIQLDEDCDIKLEVVKKHISQIEQKSTLSIESDNLPSRKSSIKLGEDGSDDEEEADSGVTSDISRHISEADIEIETTEYKKMSKYQRAATHSRLFKLLQDESETEIQEEDCDEMQIRRDLLTLPLQTNLSNHESFSSSGFTSPGSPSINEKFVNELIETLLLKKQGKVFKNMTMEKLHSAALRILQDDMDGLETLSSSEDGGSFLSPKKPDTGSSTPARTPQEYSSNLNLNDYSQYYESWAGAESLENFEYEVLPSKAFRLIQEHAARNKTGAITGLIARCPRVLSNKNIQKELMRLIESQENSSPEPSVIHQIVDINEATS